MPTNCDYCKSTIGSHDPKIEEDDLVFCSNLCKELHDGTSEQETLNFPEHQQPNQLEFSLA